MWWPAIGGLIVGIGGYLEPRALGVGYDVIGDLLHNRLALSVALALLSVKAVIWVAALGSGTSGGVLAPLLMLGAGLGIVLSPVLPGGSPGLWALVCMAAVLGSVLGAPLTAIVFAFGLTHDSEAMLPLMLTTAVACGVTALAMKRSIMTEKIARRGLHIHREYSVDPLERQHVADVMTHLPVTVDGALTVAAALHQYYGRQASHRAYPVVQDGRLLGLLTQERLQGQAAYKSCAELFSDAPHALLPGASARSAAGRMAQLGVSRLAVIDSELSMKLIGIVTVRDLLQASRKDLHEETVRERLR